MGSGGSQPLFGLMQDWPLTTDKFIEHANRWHPQREVVSRLCDGQIERRTYAEMYAKFQAHLGRPDRARHRAR